MAPSAYTAENCGALPRFPFSSPIALLSAPTPLSGTRLGGSSGHLLGCGLGVAVEEVDLRRRRSLPRLRRRRSGCRRCGTILPRCTELVYAKRPVRNGGKSACVNELEDQAVDERRRSPIVLEHQRNKKVVEERWLDWCSFTPRAGCSTFPAFRGTRPV